MADFLKGVAGLAAALAMGKMRRDSDSDYLDQIRTDNKLAPVARKKAPIDKAFDWMGDKLSALTTDPVESATPAAPAATGEQVGLMERLKAGNIDAPGSEAYNRWGDGREQGISMSDDIQAKRLSELPNASPEEGFGTPDTGITKQLFDDAPSSNMVSEQKMQGWLDSQ